MNATVVLKGIDTYEKNAVAKRAAKKKKGRPKTKGDHNLNIRLTDKVWAALQEHCDNSTPRITKTAFVEMLLEQHLRLT